MGSTEFQPAAWTVAGAMSILEVYLKKLTEEDFRGCAAQPPTTLLQVTFAVELAMIKTISGAVDTRVRAKPASKFRTPN